MSAAVTPPDQAEPERAHLAADHHRTPTGMLALFFLLVATVVATTSVMGMSAWLLVPDHLQRMAQTMSGCFAADPGLRNKLDFQTLGALSDAGHRFMQCTSPIDLEQTTWALYGVLGLIVVAVALYCAYPRWLIRSRRLTPLRLQNTPALASYLAELERAAGLRHTPTFLLGSQRGTLDGLTFGHFRRRYIALDAALLLSFTTDRAKFRAVVLHEMAHARSQDVHITYLTKSLWWAFVMIVWLPTAVYLVIERSTWELLQLAALVALTALVLLTRNAILRERELQADGLAATCDGPGSALPGVVAAMTTTPRSWRARLLATHPRLTWRRRVIAEPTLLLRPRWWEMFVVGLATAVISTNLEYVVIQALATFPALNLLVAGLVPALGLVAPLIVAVWRTVVLDPALRPPAKRLVLLAVTLTAGYLVGERVSWVALILATPEAGVGPTGPTGVIAGVLLLVGAVVVAVWTASVARSAHHATDRVPRWVLPVVVGGGTTAFAVWVAVWFTANASGQLALWLFGDDVVPYQLTVPDAPDWVTTALHWAGLIYLPLYSAASIPVLVVCLALLWLVPVIVSRAGRPVLDVRHALRVGVGGAIVFALAAVAVTLLARIGLPATSRHSDGFAFGFSLVLGDLAVLVQVGVAALIRPGHRAALIPLATMVSGLLSAAVLFLGADTFGRAVDLWAKAPQSPFMLPDLGFAADTTQKILVNGAVAAVVGALVGTALHRRDRGSPSRHHTVALVGVTIVVVALAVVETPGAYRTWITDARSGTVVLTGQACLIGSWVETARTEQLTLSQEVGPMQFTGTGGVQSFGEDGSVTAQFAPLTSITNGHTVRITFSGSVGARYHIEGDQIIYTEVSTKSTWSVAVDDKKNVITGSIGSESTDTFACTGDTMTETGNNYKITLGRVDHHG